MSGPLYFVSCCVAITALTLNQRVHGSSPCAPTIEIKDLRKSDSSLLPKKLDWEALGKQKRDFSRCALQSARCLPTVAAPTHLTGVTARRRSGALRDLSVPPQKADTCRSTSCFGGVQTGPKTRFAHLTFHRGIAVRSSLRRVSYYLPLSLPHRENCLYFSRCGMTLSIPRRRFLSSS